MLRTLLSAALFAVVLCAPRHPVNAQDAGKPDHADATIDSLRWMAGSWAGEHDGGIIEEHWMAPSGGSMGGMGRLVVGSRTVFHEYLRIVSDPNGGVVYLAQPVGRCPPTPFRLTSCTDRVAVFENPEHDNPKLIRYTLSEDGLTLTAVTEGVNRSGERVEHESVMNRSTLDPR